MLDRGWIENWNLNSPQMFIGIVAKRTKVAQGERPAGERKVCRDKIKAA